MKNHVKILCLMLVLPFLGGCGIYQLKQRTNPAKAAMNPLTTQSEFEEYLATKYKGEIHALLSRLSPGTGYSKGIAPSNNRYSIGFFTPNHSIATSPLTTKDDIYFGSVIVSGSIYNRNRTTFAERASTVFVTNTKNYLYDAFLSAGSDMFKDPQIKGVTVYIVWGLDDKINEYSSLVATYSEGLKICADWNSTKQFINNQISMQEFADKIVVLGIYNNSELGKIKIDTQKIL